MNTKYILLSILCSSFFYSCGGDSVNAEEGETSSSSALSSQALSSSKGTSSGALLSSSSTLASSGSAANLYGPGSKRIPSGGITFSLGRDSTALAAIAAAATTNDAANFQYLILSEGTPEWPVHPVTFTDDFWMDSTEVTQGQVIATLSAAGLTSAQSSIQNFWTASSKTAHMPIGDNYPANIASTYLVALYANARSKLDGLAPAYQIDTTQQSFSTDYSANGYRLPTEAEWHYAARGGVDADFSWNMPLTLPLSATDSATVSKYAVWTANSGSLAAGTQGYGPHPVASHQPNGYGLYDMAGNLSEYVGETWQWAPYSAAAITDPRDTSTFTGEMSGVFRLGGNWMSPAMMLRSDCRTYYYANYKEFGVGFRLVRKAS